MHPLSISLGNLRRRSGRTLVLVVGLSIGVALAVSMTGITSRMQQDVERKMDEYGANIVILPRSESMTLTYGGVGVADTTVGTHEMLESDVALIEGIENRKNLSAVAPKLLGQLKSGERSVLIVGVDFGTEFRIKRWWRLAEPHGTSTHGMGRELYFDPPEIDKNEVLVGSLAAASLGLTPGSELTLGKESFKVAGVLADNTSQDDYAVFLWLGQAQRLLGKPGKISMVEVSALCSDCPIEDMVAQISARLPGARVSAVRQAMQLKMQTADQLLRFSVAVTLAVTVIGALIVFVSMLASVNERTREIGLLRALGFRQSQIIRIIMAEAALVSLAAGLLGWLLGVLSVAVLGPKVMGLEAAANLSYNPVLFASSVGMALAIGLLSSIYPARKASQREPLEALRYI